jgi:hypothetical protein
MTSNDNQAHPLAQVRVGDIVVPANPSEHDSTPTAGVCVAVFPTGCTVVWLGESKCSVHYPGDVHYVADGVKETLSAAAAPLLTWD